MSTFKPKDSDVVTVNIDGKATSLLSTKAYESFNTSLLGLGDIKQTSVARDAIAAVFDLQGFTNFCKQIEPHLSVPLFLSEFLAWLLDQIKDVMTCKKHKEGAKLYGPLPFFVKFMGDGLLVLWDASVTSDTGRRNIVVSAFKICQHYPKKFLPTLQGKVVEPPPALRCGLARGTVYSVGNGNDFVGSCINMAARLEKVAGATFAFNRRGFDLETEEAAVFFKKKLVVKRMAILGIGDNELVALLKAEYDAMKASDKKQFRDP